MLNLNAIVQFFECSNCGCISDKPKGADNSVYGRWAQRHDSSGNRSPTNTSRSGTSTAREYDKPMRGLDNSCCPDPWYRHDSQQEAQQYAYRQDDHHDAHQNAYRRKSEQTTLLASLKTMVSPRKELPEPDPQAKAQVPAHSQKRRPSMERITALLSPRSGGATAKESDQPHIDQPMHGKSFMQRITGTWSQAKWRAAARDASPERQGQADVRGRRGSFMDVVKDVTGRASRETSPQTSPRGTQGRRGSVMSLLSMGSQTMLSAGSNSKENSPQGSPVRGVAPAKGGRRRSVIQRITGTAPETTSEPYIGHHAKALFHHTARDNHPVFPPDPRSEASLTPGMRLDLIDMREDGWCIVRKRPHKREYWVPGNYITVDGRTPYFDSSEGLERTEVPWGA